MPKSKKTPLVLAPVEVLHMMCKSNDAPGIARMAADPMTPHDVWKGRYVQGWGHDPLLTSAVGNLDAMKALLPLCDPNQVCGFGDTALMVAARDGELESVRLLLPLSNPNQQNRAGQNALGMVVEGLSHKSDDGDDPSALLKCAQLLIPVTDTSQTDRLGVLTVIEVLMTYARVAEHPEALWACADMLAPHGDRAVAMKVLSQAPTNAMPAFRALLEREALHGTMLGSITTSSVEKTSSRPTPRPNRGI